MGQKSTQKFGDVNKLDKQKNKGVKSARESNFELLRIIAMFMVLGLHANFWAIGEPTTNDFHTSFIPSATRVILEYICIVSVNAFVMISGWFGIRVSWKGFSNFMFQILFLMGLCWVVALYLGLCPFNPIDAVKCFMIGQNLWFPKAYLFLFILSPVLNAFVENTTKRHLIAVIASFFILQYVYGITNSTEYICQGYSPLHFIGLYLLARCIRRYFSSKKDLILLTLIGIIAIIANGFGAIARTCLTIRFVHVLFNIQYLNPLVILGSVGFIALFARLDIGVKRVINWISASCFAVFLIHTSPWLQGEYKAFINHIYDRYDGIICLGIILTGLIAIFIVCILVDKVRLFFWRKIRRRPFFQNKMALEP